MDKSSATETIVASIINHLLDSPLSYIGFRMITFILLIISFLPVKVITNSYLQLRKTSFAQSYISLTPTIYMFYSVISLVIAALFVIRLLSELNGYGVYEKDWIFTAATIFGVYSFSYLQIAANIFGSEAGIPAYISSMEDMYSDVQLLPFLMGWFLIAIFALVLVVEIFTDRFRNS